MRLIVSTLLDTIACVPMSLERLSDPLPGELPVGEDCQSEIQAQNFALMTEYLVERAIQKGRERAADQPGLEAAEARNAAGVRDDGKRRLTSLEAILKDVLNLSTVNVEQVGKVLRDRTSALLAQRGKDLRLMPYLGAACTVIDGLEGYAAALKLALALLQAYPKILFPLPDDEEADDLWQRANAVAELLSGDGIHALLGQVVVIDAKRSRRLTLADLVGGSRADISVSEVAQSDLVTALDEIGPERARTLLARFREIEASVTSLERTFDAGTLPTTRLGGTFRRAAERLGPLVQAGDSATGAANALTANEKAGESYGAVDTRPGLRSREDARRAIQDVVRFIEKIEPGHPAPLLLKRADRLLGMGFCDIIKDMAPNAMPDIERIAGPEQSG